MSSTDKAALRLDWCSSQAAQYACEHWHYSKSISMPPRVHIGVWEHGEFVGAIVYARGANLSIGSVFGLPQTQACELVRVALRAHKSPVSRMLAISLKMIRKNQPGLRLVVSYADPFELHHGGIYQANGWIYVGDTKPGRELQLNGRRLQKRAYTGVQFGTSARSNVPVGAIWVKTKSKHKYIYPLDADMRDRVSALSRPYPKRHACSGVAGAETPSRSDVRPDQHAL